jgi:hypothetical protein
VPTRPRHSTNSDGAFGVRGAGDANPLQISGAAAPPLGCAATREDAARTVLAFSGLATG